MSSAYVKAAFIHVKAAYEKLREQERVELKKSLMEYFQKDPKAKAAGLEVVDGPTAGKGSDHFGKNFDLRNWKWIEVKGTNGFRCIVSLNLPGTAPDTKMPVALYDRVGLVLSKEKEDWFDTEINLPLTPGKRKKIAKFVVDRL